MEICVVSAFLAMMNNDAWDICVYNLCVIFVGISLFCLLRQTLTVEPRLVLNL